jgi:dTDP-4-amino-4,6-dideoxygalactose transaminase
VSGQPEVPAARVVFSEDDRREIAALVDESLRTGSLTLGPRTLALESAFAQRHTLTNAPTNVPTGAPSGAPTDAPTHAVAVASGTAALEIVLRWIDVAGGEVVVPANTFYATAGAVLLAGGTPRFADVDATTLALRPDALEAAITPATRAVIVVHIGGVISPAVEELAATCGRHGIPLVEDAAHAHGSSWRGRPAGSFGIAACFSGYPTKVVTSAEGGMILTADAGLDEAARVFRDQGKAGFHGGAHVRVGAAWRMSELHAAVGLVHLRRLDEFIAVRDAVARAYDEGLAGIPGITRVAVPAGCATNHYKYVALLDAGIDRAALKEHARTGHGVTMSGEVYARPLHHEPVFAAALAAAPPGPLSVAEDVCARQVCLPVHSDMTTAESAQVLTALRSVLSGQ